MEWILEGTFITAVIIGISLLLRGLPGAIMGILLLPPMMLIYGSNLAEKFLPRGSSRYAYILSICLGIIAYPWYKGVFLGWLHWPVAARWFLFIAAIYAACLLCAVIIYPRFAMLSFKSEHIAGLLEDDAAFAKVGIAFHPKIPIDTRLEVENQKTHVKINVVVKKNYPPMTGKRNEILLDHAAFKTLGLSEKGEEVYVKMLG